MKLFYKPGACSLASHIILREISATFSLDEVDTTTGQTKSGLDYSIINPKGYVPALQLETGEVLTEGVSILQFIADRNHGNQLAPAQGSVSRARLQEYLNYTSSELHKAFGPLFSDSATEAQKSDARKNVAKKIDYFSTLLEDGKEYLVDNKFSVADSYAFVVLNWANFTGIDLGDWPSVLSYVARIGARPSVKEALQAEGLV
ncbi:glutathione transferase GstA [Alphaproteobacteria bacterium 46_93_T64]|nr:glutathione transferase GstA [Alphaproteobacteria bacterium 46_93_T64]